MFSNADGNDECSVPCEVKPQHKILHLNAGERPIRKQRHRISSELIQNRILKIDNVFVADGEFGFDGCLPAADGIAAGNREDLQLDDRCQL